MGVSKPEKQIDDERVHQIDKEARHQRHLLEVVAIAAIPTLGLSALKEVFRFDFL